MAKKAREIAELIGGELVGDGEVMVGSIGDIKYAGNGDLAFVIHPKFSELLNGTKASCVVVPQTIEKAHCTIIRSKNPQLAFGKIVDFLGVGKIPHPKGIHPTVVIGKNVTMGKDVGVGPYVVISDNAVIGDRSIVYSFTHIGDGTRIGSDCVVYSNVSIREQIVIGNRVIIHSGTVVGSDGFGYDSSTGVHVKIPQIGNVVIEDDVEIGACVAIDRAKFASTRIGRGTKIDNQCQIAHNVKIGQGCIIVAHTGISGSTELGNGVVLGGKVGIVDHVKIGDGVMAGAGSGIMKSIPPKSVVWGIPARPITKTKKIFAIMDLLPELYKRILRLEKILKIDKQSK